MTDDDRIARLLRARSYPYAAPAGSYLLERGQVLEFDPAATRGRTPILAIGSNRAPEQLIRKYGPDHEHPLPVQRARLRNFDVVYAAHISAYGAVPAMLQSAPGVSVLLSVTWLDDAQLDVMHRTEGNYHFAVLEQVGLTLDTDEVLDDVHLYVARLGHAVHEMAPVGLTDVPAEGRHYRQHTTAEMLELVHRRLGHALGADEMDHDAFVLKLVADPHFRERAIALLSADAVQFQHPFRILGSF